VLDCQFVVIYVALTGGLKAIGMYLSIGTLRVDISVRVLDRSRGDPDHGSGQEVHGAVDETRDEGDGPGQHHGNHLNAQQHLDKKPGKYVYC